MYNSEPNSSTACMQEPQPLQSQYTTYKGAFRLLYSRNTFHYSLLMKLQMSAGRMRPTVRGLCHVTPCSLLNFSLILSTDVTTTGCLHHAASEANISTHMGRHWSTSPAEGTFCFQLLMSRFQTAAHHVTENVKRRWKIARSTVHELQRSMMWSERVGEGQWDEGLWWGAQYLQSRHRKWKITNCS